VRFGSQAKRSFLEWRRDHAVRSIRLLTVSAACTSALAGCASLALVACGASQPAHTQQALALPVGSPYVLKVRKPVAVTEAGGRELEEFEAGRMVASSSGCEACHRIGESGNPGPGASLTHVGAKLSRREIHEALLKPKAPMPSFKHLQHQRLHDLIAFLALLK
jgi:hypothetical protein